MKKYLLGAAMIVAGALAMGAATMAAAPVPAPAAPVVIDANAPTPPPANDDANFANTAQFRRMPMMTGAARFGGRTASGRTMMGNQQGDFRRGGSFGIVHAIAGAITLGLVWTVLVMVIILLCRKLKKPTA